MRSLDTTTRVLTRTQNRRAQRKYTLSCLKAALQVSGKQLGQKGCSEHVAKHTVGAMPNKDVLGGPSNVEEEAVRYVVVEVPQQREQKSLVGKNCKWCGIWEPMCGSPFGACSSETDPNLSFSGAAKSQEVLSRTLEADRVENADEDDDFLSVLSLSLEEQETDLLTVVAGGGVLDDAQPSNEQSAHDELFRYCVMRWISLPWPITAEVGQSSDAAMSVDFGDDSEQQICWKDLHAPVGATIVAPHDVAALAEPSFTSSVVGHFASGASFYVDCCVATMNDDCDVRLYCREVNASCWIQFDFPDQGVDKQVVHLASDITLDMINQWGES